MKSTIVCFCILLALVSGTAGGSETVQIQLIDGSMISGEMISFREGVYTVRTDSIGTVEINESQVKMIRMGTQGAASLDPANTSNSSMDNTIQALQKSIAQDPQIMELILTLQNDPAIQELLKDPTIINALSTGDINTLMASPEFLKILENPTIQHIQQEALK